MRQHLLADDLRPEAEPIIGIPARQLEGDLVAYLMRRHEVAAERLIGWMRVAIGICIFVTMIATDHLLRQLFGVSLDLFERSAAGEQIIILAPHARQKSRTRWPKA